MTSVKTKILLGIAKRKRVDNPIDLVPDAETDMHNTVHILYSLNKRGLVAFRENKLGGMQYPTRIMLTKAGQKEAKRLQR